MPPPSFSVSTGAAAAVGQMTQMNTPSMMILASTSSAGRSLMTRTTMAVSSTLMPCSAKCHLRGRKLCMSILQNVR